MDDEAEDDDDDIGRVIFDLSVRFLELDGLIPLISSFLELVREPEVDPCPYLEGLVVMVATGTDDDDGISRENISINLEKVVVVVGL